ncbi:MAG: DEAD/DEAH box helicase [Saprospiraceae bacterium]|nr:DEAD/DEAH box helicase [Saprospiraceae bacterium]
MDFSDFGLHPSIMEGLDAMGFNTPTPIQEQTIPHILNGRDILACAQTGTGKTAAFLLPILHELSTAPSDVIDTLILEPTRELVMQVDQQLEGFSYFTDVRAIPVYGGRDGHSMEQERKALKQGASVIVASPGRLIAHLDLGYVNFDKLRHLVLDEADRMLDMGFAPDIMKIVNMLPRKRQTLLFSATMPQQIRRFAREMLNNPVEVSISVSKPAENIMQVAYEVEDEQKVALTAHLLQDKKRLERVLIFASTKIKVRELAGNLARRGMKVSDIQSDLDQNEREERLRAFRSGALPIVVATDVLSRGIDVKGIDLVLNYDVPSDGEDYVHRIGRTARADASGIAITLVNRKDRRRFDRIEQTIGMKIRRMPLPPDFQARPSSESRQQSSSRRPANPARPPQQGPRNEAQPGGEERRKKRRPDNRRRGPGPGQGKGE